ncbi:MAG TPA: pilus assembly protein N-terminal domain-containing protein [Polyangiaceae bacterium]
MKIARVVVGAATVAVCIGLTTNVALAQRGGKDKTEATNGDEIQLAIGESKTLSAKGVKNYSDSTPGVASIALTPDGSQFIIAGKKPGSTTLLLIKDDGSQVQFPITVTSKSLANVEKDLNQLTEGISGIHVRRVGNRFFIEGGVTSDADLKRVQQIASLYPGQVESLVTVGGGTGGDRKLLIRLDFFFVQYDRNSTYAVGIGWPTAIGGIYNGQQVVQSQFTYDFIGKSVTTAQASIANQPLPELDIAMTHGWAKVLKQSTVITANGQEASFQSGGENNYLSSVGLTSALVSIKFGTNVQILPRFDSSTKELELKLDADVADLTPPESGTLPGRSETKLQTLVSLKLGQALVLSGIRSRSQRHSVTGLPGLSQIPVVGLLFGRHSDQQEDIEGAIFIVPSVIETVPKSSIEVIKNALSTYDEFSGELEKVDSFNKTPPSAK